jgi:hypothetical protein
MGLEDEIREELNKIAPRPPGGLPLRHAMPSGEDDETRLVRLELQVGGQREVLLRLAREIENLSSKSS